jgi:hypothetical protein
VKTFLFKLKISFSFFGYFWTPFLKRCRITIASFKLALKIQCLIDFFFVLMITLELFSITVRVTGWQWSVAELPVRVDAIVI